MFKANDLLRFHSFETWLCIELPKIVLDMIIMMLCSLFVHAERQFTYIYWNVEGFVERESLSVRLERICIIITVQDALDIFGMLGWLSNE